MSRIDLLQDVEVLWPTVAVHKDKVLLFLDDTGKQFKQSTYIQSLSYVCLSVSFAWTGGGNCVFYDREDMHLFSTGTEPLLSMMLARHNRSHNGHQHRREGVGFKITRRHSDNTSNHTLQQYTVGEGSSIAHAMWSHMSTVSEESFNCNKTSHQ